MLGSPTTPHPPLPHQLLRLLAVALPVLALLVGGLVAPADAAAGPTLSLTGPTEAKRGSTVALTAALRNTAGQPMVGQAVRLERDGTTTVDTRQTGDDGTVTFQVTLGASAKFRAVRDLVGDGTGDNAAVTSPDRTVRAYDAPTALSTKGPATGYVDGRSTVTTTLTRTDTSAPVAGERVALQRRISGVWQTVQTATTSATGVATYSVVVRPTDNTFHTVYAGRFDSADASLQGSRSGTVTIAPRKRNTELRLTGPDRVVDEKAATLRLTWRAGNGDPVPGSVIVQQRVGDTWRKHASVKLGADGKASVMVRPRSDSRWRAVGAAGRWWLADTSDVKAIDNVPPGTPVAYPEAAPRPAVKLAKNARAKGGGANATVGRISDAMWRSMVGRTWHSGCPVGRSQLRVVRVNYWGYDGYRYRGEIVLRDSVAGRGAAMFTSLYKQKLPIWRMYRVDRFGWSAKLHGGNDYRAMRAGNTSGFNCRGVTGNPSVTSPHSYGRSIDLNTWENPYRSREGLVPNSWWQYHSHPRIAWRSRSHPVVRTMAAHGFRWTYGLGDTQHFDG